MKIKVINHPNRNFIGIMLIITYLLGCEPKFILVPDLPDKCEEQSNFSNTELIISHFKVSDLPDVCNYKEEEFEELELMFVEYIKNRNTFKEIYPSFTKKETAEGSYLIMDVEIIPNASYEKHYSCLDACIWGVSLGGLPGVSATEANIKITTNAKIRNSKEKIVKELRAEGITSESSNMYGFPGIFGGEEKTRKINKLFEKSYKKSFNLISEYISEARTELIDTITADTVKLSDEQISRKELDEKTEKISEKSEAPVELKDTITATDTVKLYDNKRYMEEFDKKIGKRDGKRYADTNFNPALWIFNGVGTGFISLGSGMIVELTKYYSSGEEEMTGGTEYYYYYCLGMGLLGAIQSYFKSPPPPNPNVFIGKSPEYIESYTNEYKMASRKNQVVTFGLSYFLTHAASIMSLFIYSEASTTP